MNRLYIVVAGVFLAATASTLHAQGTAGAAPQNQTAREAQRRNQCRLAAQVISKGHPTPHERWAWETLPFCGAEGARALSMAIRASAGSDDDSTLAAAARAARELPHPVVLEAGLDVAASAAGTPKARAYALLAAAGVLQPTYVFPSLADFTVPPPSAGRIDVCAPVTLSHGPTPIEPIPELLRARAVSLFAHLASESDAPEPVRHGAYCGRLWITSQMSR